jgi:hypothetical protein
MKFKAPIEVESSLVDSSNSSGSAGQVLTSTGVGVDWIDPTLLPAESAEKVIQTVRFGEAVSKGDPLVVTGYHGPTGPAIVERADATDATKMPAYGVALEDYANNATGLMIAVGDFNDFDTSSYSVGDTLYVAVGGGMTNVKPTGTALIQNMGIVSRSNANNGDVEIVAIGRTNDVPNLPTGRLFVGTATNTSLISDVVYIDDANDRVGIGTTSPGSKLTVFGDIMLRNPNGANPTDAGSFIFNESGTTWGTDIYGFRFNLNGISNVLTLQSANTTTVNDIISFTRDAGNVGIGTTSPSAKLQVNGNIRVPYNASNLYYFGQDNGSIGYGSMHPFDNGGNYTFDTNYAPSVGSYKFKYNGTEIFRLRDTGAFAFGSGGNDYGIPGQILKSLGNASPTWVDASTVIGGPYLPLAGGTMTGTSGVLFPDNFKLNIGTGSDLQIYHDGSNSFIEDVGTGSLLLKSNGAGIYLKGFTSTDTYAQFLEGGAVNLYYDNSKKFETTSTGVTVTGDVTASGTVNADTYFQSTDASAVLATNGAGSVFLRPNGPSSGTGALSVASSGNVVALGTVAAPTFLGDLNGTINTATTAVTKANSTNDTTVATTAFVQNLIGTIPAGLVFQGTWNAATNTPTLTSGTGTTGNFYIVSVDGSTNLDGITDWKVGDWAVFVEQGASDQWQKVDNSSVLDGSGTGQTVALWSGSGTSNTLTDAPITVSGNNTTFAGSMTANTTSVPTALFGRDGTDGDVVQVFNGATGTTKVIALGATGNDGTIYSQYGNLILQQSAGNVGIGTTSPLVKLQVGDFAGTGGFSRGTTSTIYGGFETNRSTLFIGTTDTSAIDTGGSIALGGQTGVSSNMYTFGSIIGAKESSTAGYAGYLGFKTTPAGSNLTFERMRISSAGAIKFNAYDSTNNTGTPTYLLGTDASGNIVKTNTVPGSATGPYLPLAGGTMTGNLFIEGVSTPTITITDTTNNLEGKIRVANNYMYIDADNSDTVGSTRILLRTDGVEALRLDENQNATFGGTIAVQGTGNSSFAGNVGIGMTSPSYKLDVSGTGNFQSNLQISNADQSTTRLLINNTSSSGNRTFALVGGIHNASQEGFSIYDTVAADTRLVILNDGNVGIGTTNPLYKLDVNGRGRFTGATLFQSQLTVAGGSGDSVLEVGNSGIGGNHRINIIPAGSGQDAGYYISGTPRVYTNTGNTSITRINAPSTGIIQFETNLTERVRINNGGNVSIGNQNNTYKLDVSGAGRFTDTLRISGASPNKLRLISNDTTGDNYISFFENDDSTLKGLLGYTPSETDEFLIYQAENSSVDFYTNATYRMRITSTGNVGIGTTSPSEKLEVDGTIKATDYKGYLTTFQHGGFQHTASTSSTTVYWIPTNNNSEVISSQSYNNWVAPYDGRVKKIVMRWASNGTPTATSVIFRKAINGTTDATLYSATVTSPATTAMIVGRDFLSTDISFQAGDRVQLGFTTDGGTGLLQGFAYTIVLEYNKD